MQGDVKKAKALAATDLAQNTLPQSYRDAVQLEIDRTLTNLKDDSKIKVSTSKSVLWIVLGAFGACVFLLTVLLLDAVNIVDLSRYGPAVAPTGTSSGAIIPESPAGMGELMGAFLPLVTIAIAFFVGATGLSRLQLYDDQFAQNRKERREDIGDLRRQLAQETGSLKDALIADVSELARSQESQAAAASQSIEALRSRIDEARKELDVKFDKSKEEFFRTAKSDAELSVRDTLKTETSALAEKLKLHTSELDEIKASIDNKVRPLEWILKDPDLETTLSAGSVASMGELHNKMTELFESKQRDAAVRLLQRSLTEGLTGSSDDFFNASTELARRDLEVLGLDIAEAGLLIYPDNPDLLANALKFSAMLQDKDKSNALWKRIQALPVSSRNWRIEVFSGSFLRDTEGVEAERSFYYAYLARYFDMTTWRKLDVWPENALEERVAAALASGLLAFGRVQEAITITQAILDAGIRAPQCAHIQARAYLSLNNFPKAIEGTSRALRDDALDQSSISISAAYNTRANAFDSYFMEQSEHGSDSDAKKVISLARSALLSYSASLRSRDSVVVPVSIVLRVNIILSRLLEVGVATDDISAIIPDELRDMAPASFSGGGTQTGGAGVDRKLNNILATAHAIAENEDGDQDASIIALTDAIMERSDSKKDLQQTIAYLVSAREHFEEKNPALAAVLRQLLARLQ